MMMQMLGAFAEFERSLIRERTSAGLAAARAEGRIGGRRPKLTSQQRADIADNVLSGRKTAADMARLYGISQPTVSRIVAGYRGSHSWLGEFGQRAKWSFCLRAARMAAEQEKR